MEHPVKVAACKILFGKNGGTFTELGNPIWEKDVKALCDKAWDCGHCPYLHEWVAYRIAEGYSISWECDLCLRQTEKPDKAAGTERIVTGYYQSGRKFQMDSDDPMFDPDRPGLEGCTRVIPETREVCGWESSFLQLVLRRRK